MVRFLPVHPGNGRDTRKGDEKSHPPRGDYRLAPAFQHLAVKADQWVDMGTTQKESHYERCFSKPLDKLAKVDEGEAEPDIDEEALSVSYKDSGITTMSIANLKQMWRSAANRLFAVTSKSA